MNQDRQALALSQYWDARQANSSIPPPDQADARLIDALLAEATAAPAASFVRLLRHDLTKPAAAPVLDEPVQLLAPWPMQAPGERPYVRPADSRASGSLGTRVMAMAALALLALLGVATIFVAPSGSQPPPAAQFAAPLQSPVTSDGRPLQLSLPRWDAAISLIPVDAALLSEVGSSEFGDAVFAGWDQQSGASAGRATVVIALSTGWSDAVSTGDTVEIVSSDLVQYTYQLGAPSTQPSVDNGSWNNVAFDYSAADMLLLGDTAEFGPSRDQLTVIPGELVASAPFEMAAAPGTAACTHAPISLDRLDSAVIRLQRDVAPDQAANAKPAVSDPGQTPTSVNQQTAAAILATATQFAACLNSGDELRALAMFTDAGLESLFRFVFDDMISGPYQFTPDFTELLLTPPPSLPPAYVVMQVTDIKQDAAGTISASVWIADLTPDGATAEDQVSVLPLRAPLRLDFAPQSDGSYQIAGYAYAPSAGNFPIPDAGGTPVPMR